MVYVNSFNAIIGVGLIILLSAFIIFVGYLWVQNLQERADESIQEELTGKDCDCFDTISDNGDEAVFMNVKCDFVSDLIIVAGAEVFKFEKPLYYEEFVRVDYEFKPPYYTIIYNNCTQTLIS